MHYESKLLFYEKFEFLFQEDDTTSADGRRKQYRKQRTVQSWEFEAEGDIAQPEFMVKPITNNTLS
jgi:hypothetical protein